MSMNHGINATKATATPAPVKKTTSGIPFFVGVWPCHRAGGYTGKPQIAYSLAEAKAAGGYSESWRDSSGNPKYSLCQAMYSHFTLFKMAPAVFMNVFDPATHKAAGTSTGSKSVTDHEVVINEDVIVNSTLSVKGTVNETFDGDGAAVEFTLAAASKPATVTSVKVAGSTVEIVTTGEPTAAQVLYTAATGKLTFGTAPAEGTANIIVAYTGDLVRDTDYEIVWEGESFVISLLSGRPCYTDTTITLSAYDVVSLSAITATTIEAAIEEIDACKGLFGVVPDLICCPGWSQTPAVAAVMAAKAPNIDGLFKAKAVVDIDTDSSTGAVSYEEVLAWKTTNGYTDVDMIVCWPLVKAGAYVFDMSVILCGILARTDSGNNDCPYESPSNKSIAISGMCVKAGTDINLTPAEADIISYSAGVVTALNFDGWVSWGNRAGCWPGSTNAFEYFNSNSRMMDWLCNTFVNRFWAKLSKPLTRVMIDSIVNEYNSWMNGLTSEGKLYGGEIEYVEAANPISDLIAGKFKLHTKMASPSPAERIDMSVEYDIDYLTAAFATL